MFLASASRFVCVAAVVPFAHVREDVIANIEERQFLTWKRATWCFIVLFTAVKGTSDFLGPMKAPSLQCRMCFPML